MSLQHSRMLVVGHLKLDEGYSDTPYYCSEGFPTVGFGRKIGGKNERLPDYTTNECNELGWVERCVKEIQDELKDLIAVFTKLDSVRQAVLINMAYQLGVVGLCKFQKTIGLIEDCFFEAASKEMLSSLWASQTPERAGRMANMMKCGKIDDYYS